MAFRKRCEVVEKLLCVLCITKPAVGVKFGGIVVYGSIEEVFGGIHAEGGLDLFNFS